jgi:hypothetical protein
MYVPKWFGLFVAGLIVVSAVLFMVLPGTLGQSNRSQVQSTEAFAAPQAGVKLSFPNANLVKLALSEEDKKDKLLLRLANRKGKEKELLVTVRYEDGLRPIATLTKQDLRDILAGNIAKSYPKRFPDFKLQDQRSFELDSHKAKEIIFTYKGPNGKRVKQRFMFVVRNDDMAVYIAAQSRENDYDRLNKEYFEPVIKSLEVD